MNQATERDLGGWTLPAMQARSRETRDQLLAAGLGLVERVPYARLRISDIADGAGCSVGTFYRRFPDKQSFLFALQDMANRDFLERLGTDLQDTMSPSETLRTAVSLLVADRRSRRGLATASLRHATSNGGAWMPFYEAALGLDRLLKARLAVQIPPAGRRPSASQIGFATQAMFGILNQATFISSGAVLLDDDRLVDELTRMCSRYLGLEEPK